MALAHAVGVRFPRAVRFFARRGAARRHAPPCTYPAMIAPSLALSYFHALTEAVPRYDARRRPPGEDVAMPRKPYPVDGRPPYS